MQDAATWDVYCKVVDNHGDLGVAWRLAAGLAARGLRVRLWCDDLDRLAWMAPGGDAGVTAAAWAAAEDVAPGDVVVETFGCDLPPAVLATIARRHRPPVWIDLEYLTAEPYAERSHGLPSPQSTGPGAGATRWFFYPGFTEQSGGLLHGGDLTAHRQRFDPAAWWRERGIERRPAEQVVSLFCYPGAPVPALIARLAASPTLLVATAGEAARAVEAALGPTLAHGALRAAVLPFLPQTEYDHLLRASDLNLVRGEDSFVRAQLAGRPFLWQIYPQADGAHRAKLEAFMALFLRETDGAGTALSGGEAWRRSMLAWNGASAGQDLPPLPLQSEHVARAAHWRTHLLGQPDLVERLVAFAAARRPG